jgi:uncharacterized protein (DUF1330 family)
MTRSGRTTLSERPEYEPWVLVNLLRFKHRVTTADGSSISGAAAYERYFDACQPVLKRFGGTIVWAGDTQFAVAGLSRSTPPESQPQWDRVVVVRYPTPAAYRAFVGDPEYRQALTLKEEAVTDTQVLVCSPDGAFEPVQAETASGSNE